MGAVKRLARVLERVEQNTAASVFLRRDDARLYDLARVSDARRKAGVSLGPLDGQVVVIKGNIDVRGLPTTAGSRSFGAPTATECAPLVRQLVDAGALPMGHANMSEFAFSGLGTNPHFGTPPNGLNADLVPGGSSSGCASAIALGIADMAVGTDTSGSVRVPAAYQGIIGFRPTLGRYDNRGILPLAPALDTPGPMARNMQTITYLDQAMRLTAPSKTVPPVHRHVVLPTAADLGCLSPEIETLLDDVCRQLQTDGWRVQRRPIPVLPAVRALFAQYGTLVAAQARINLGAYTRLDNPRLDPNVRVRLDAARQISTADIAALTDARPRLQAQLRDQLDGAVMILPTVPDLPPRLDMIADQTGFARHNARALSLTMLGAFLDMPALALPFGQGLPGYSLTITAPQGTDDVVLNTGTALEPLLSRTNQVISA